MAQRHTLFARGNAKGRNKATGAMQGLVVSRLEDIFNATKNAQSDIAKEAGEIILKNTLPKVPMFTGALRDSGRVEAGMSVTGNVTVQVTFGNSEVDYAVFVHEDMPRDVEKRYTTPGTGPKYLQLGAAESVDEVNEHVRRRMAQVAQGSGRGGGRR